jgi:hypothetical protein
LVGSASPCWAQIEQTSIAYIEVKTISKKEGAVGRGIGSKGTGFRFGSNMSVVTSEHLLSKLEPYDLANREIFVRFGSPDATPRKAIIVDEDRSKDVLILKVRKPEVEIPRLHSSSTINLEENETAVCAAGFPHGYGYTKRCGKLQSLDGPFVEGLSHLYTTDFTFGPGMSGAPVYEKNSGAVIGIVKGREDSDEVAVGFVVPINYALRLLPTVLYASSPDAKPIETALLSAEPAAAIVFETETVVDSQNEKKEKSFYHRNQHCKRTSVQKWEIKAPEGSLIDTDSVSLSNKKASSKSVLPKIVSISESKIVVQAIAINNGSCVKIFGDVVSRDGRGSVGVKVNYELIKNTTEIKENVVKLNLEVGESVSLEGAIPESIRLSIRDERNNIEEVKLGGKSLNGWAIKEAGMSADRFVVTR